MALRYKPSRGLDPLNYPAAISFSVPQSSRHKDPNPCRIQFRMSVASFVPINFVAFIGINLEGDSWLLPGFGEFRGIWAKDMREQRDTETVVFISFVQRNCTRNPTEFDGRTNLFLLMIIRGYWIRLQLLSYLYEVCKNASYEGHDYSNE